MVTRQQVVDADTSDVADAIRTGGLANRKAPRIQDALEEVHERYGDYSLDVLRILPLDEAKVALTSIDGVGPKTAACVLLFALGRPAMPVDTHVYRVASRLPLIAPGGSYDYVSGCPLDTPTGAMSGSYRMVDEDGNAFDVAIPRFHLLSSVN